MSGDAPRIVRRAALPPHDRGPLPDCVLWSGDPNWYTAFHDLSRLRERTRALGVPFPLVLMDHVGWPYARRDGYADPEAIPEEHRNPSRPLGVRPASVLPVAVGGFQLERHNGVLVGGSHNGVLTAVEDFLEASRDDGIPPAFARIPGFHPLGILADASRKGRDGFLGEILADPGAALARRGLAHALARSEVAARAPTLEALQAATLAPPADGQGFDDLPTPAPSGNVLRDLLRWTLMSHRFQAQLLRAVDEILTSARIRYTVAEGTLLGAMRHGGPIPHDDDTDLVIAEEDMDRMARALVEQGLTAVETRQWASMGRTFVLGIRHPWVERCGYWPTRPAMDVFPVTRGPGAFVRPGEMRRLTRVPYCDFTVAAPVNARAVLDRRFGPAWDRECVVWQHGAIPEVGRDGGRIPLDDYLEVCHEEGYEPPRTLPLDALRAAGGA